MARVRLNEKERRAMIVEAAKKARDQKGIYGFSADDVASLCEIPTSAATVRRYFHTLSELRERVENGDF